MEIKNPLVSVVMPFLGSIEALQEALHSLKNQLYLDWELILILDVKLRPEVANKVKLLVENEPSIYVYSGPQVGGPAANRNFAIEKAGGQYIAFLDADDFWYPDKLQIQFNFMMQNQIDMSFHSYDVYSEDLKKKIETRVAPISVSYQSLLRHNDIGLSTVLIKKHVLTNNQFEDLGHEDYKLWLDLIEKIKVMGLQKSLSGYRLSKGALSANKFKAAIWRWHVLKNLKLRIWQRIYFFSIYILKALMTRLIRRFDRARL